MCGIYAVVNDSDAAQTVLSGLKKLEYRGYDSWGIAVQTAGDNILIEKQVGKITVDHAELPKTSVGLGHTRWATHGGVTQKNAHPHADCTGKVVVVHNGIVENYQELKAKLAEHTFVSQTDTEVFAHLIEELTKKYTFVEAVRHAFLKADGLNALIALDAKTGTLVAIKIGSPLVIGEDATRFFIASDPASLAGQVNQLQPLDDGEMVVITAEKMQLFDAATGKKKRLRLEKFDMKVEATSMGAYPHFTIKEIHEQPAVLKNILDQPDTQVQIIAKQAAKAKHVTFVGCGSASYVCLEAKYFFAKLTDKHVDTYQGNELASFLPDLIRDTYPIFVSQSGETIDLVQPAQVLKKEGVRLGCLTNVYNSSMYRLADDRVLLKAGPEISVASTKAITSMLAHTLLLAGAVGGKQTQVHADLSRAISSVKTMLKTAYIQQYVQPIVRRLKKESNICVIGRDAMYPIALETALKLKELTYIHAEGFAGGELKHGMLTLITKGSPCIVLAPNGESYAETVSNAAEVKARGGYIIGVAAKNNEVFDAWLPAGDAGIASSISQIVAVQLLVYHLAVALGREIDKPRNLAKSVVVK